MYLAVDAGGSKCLAALFDEELRLVASGRSGGVNTNTTTLADCRRNVADCLDQLLTFYPGGAIERAFYVFVGPGDVLDEALAARYTVLGKTYLGEGAAGLLAGGGYETGVTALAGTGSDAFYVRESRHIATVGGWGPILGDQGSGAWIGQQAIRAAVLMQEGCGPDTILLSMILQHWRLDRPWGMVNRVYGAPSPFREVASLTPLAGQAAREGDEVARKIFERAGQLLAEQVASLIRREQIPPDQQQVIACGGAWKAYRGMFERFRVALHELSPHARADRARFEPIAAGPASILLSRGMAPGEVMAALADRLGPFQIAWGDEEDGRDGSIL